MIKLRGILVRFVLIVVVIMSDYDRDFDVVVVGGGYNGLVVVVYLVWVGF